VVFELDLGNMKWFLTLICISALSIMLIIGSCSKPLTNTGGYQDNGTVSTLAGPSFEVAGFGPGGATFSSPTGVAVDASGNVYVADQGNNKIRKISPSGQVITLAGSGKKGSANGPDTLASFYQPSGVALDQYGNVYVADYANNLIRMINPAGIVSTVAGTGATGNSNGNSNVASFDGPSGIAVDGAGNIYVADQHNNMIRKISPNGTVTTLAGSGTPGFTNGTGTGATFTYPTGVAVSGDGSVYVADYGNQVIRKIDPYAIVSTYAGDGSLPFANGPAAAATFDYPFGIAVSGSGIVYVAEQGNQDIRMITTSGIVSTFAGSGTAGSKNGPGNIASFWYPLGLAVDGSDNVYVADQSNNMIRKINSSDIVSTLAGTGLSGASNSNDLYSASFKNPSGVAVDGQGNVYVADTYSMVIRKISSAGDVSTLAGNGSSTSIDGPDSTASFFFPFGIAVDAHGNIYVSELDNKIRMISTSGVVTTLAGNLGRVGSANGLGTMASFNQPSGIAVDASGNIYVADAGNNLIREISPAGMVSTLAGSGAAGSANSSSLDMASFNHPMGVAVDAAGNVYVADAGNNLIREIQPLRGVITLAGTGSPSSLNGALAKSTFKYPTGIAVDVAGQLYIADNGNNMIRMITALVSSLAGSGIVGSVNGVGPFASFNSPIGVAVDAMGYVYVADAYNNLIRKIAQTP
jgi:DNA-binding beta-propeller fold protein YncE